MTKSVAQMLKSDFRRFLLDVDSREKVGAPRRTHVVCPLATACGRSRWCVCACVRHDSQSGKSSATST